MSIIYDSPIGLSIYRNGGGRDDNVYYTITGNVSSEHTVKEFDCAYDFESWIKKNVACKTIQFDSEYCQFFALTKTKRGAIAFVKRIEKLCKRVVELFN